MDLKQIEKLMVAMGRTHMKRVAIKREGFELELEKECASDTYVVQHALPHAPPPKPVAVEAPGEGAPQAESVDGEFITSPMVGTFYASPSPDDPPFVKVGDTVDETTVVCIVEAMKVMNEVKAGQAGKVVEILAKNGDPVEFGTNILRIET